MCPPQVRPSVQVSPQEPPGLPNYGRATLRTSVGSVTPHKALASGIGFGSRLLSYSGGAARTPETHFWEATIESLGRWFAYPETSNPRTVSVAARRDHVCLAPEHFRLRSLPVSRWRFAADAGAMGFQSPSSLLPHDYWEFGRGEQSTKTIVERTQAGTAKACKYAG